MFYTLAVCVLTGLLLCDKDPGPGLAEESCVVPSLEEVATAHYRRLLAQLDRQFAEFAEAEDADAAVESIRKSIRALSSKDVFDDWTAYRAIGAHRGEVALDPLTTLAQWQVMNARLKAMDDSLVRIREVEVRTRRGLVAIDAPAEFREPLVSTRRENEFRLRVYEVRNYVGYFGSSMIRAVVLGEPPFDIDSPAIDRFFDPEFLAMARKQMDHFRTLDPRNSAQPGE